MKLLFKSLRVTVALTVGLLSVPVFHAHGQASEFFDFFFSDNAGQPAQNFKGFIQWNVTDPASTTNSSVDFVGGTMIGALNYPAGRFVDLGGSTGQPANFSTKAPVVLVPGMMYSLLVRIASTEAVLSLGGPGANTLITPTPDGPLDTMRGSISGQNFTFATSSSTFQNIVVNFTAGTSTVLSLQDLGFVDPVTGATRFDNSGVALDGIMISPAVMPEPATWAMLGLGGAGLLGAGITRRRATLCIR